MDEELIWDLTWDVCMAWMHHNPGEQIDQNVIKLIHQEIIKDYDSLSVRYKELKGKANETNHRTANQV